MKGKCLVLSFTSVLILNLSAQEAILSFGSYFEKSNSSLTCTTGEAMSETYDNGHNIITQRFQQNRLSVVSIFELEDPNISVKIDQNPTNDFVHLQIDGFKNHHCQLYNFNGKEFKKINISLNKTTISFVNFSNSVYF